MDTKFTSCINILLRLPVFTVIGGVTQSLICPSRGKQKRTSCAVEPRRVTSDEIRWMVLALNPILYVLTDMTSSLKQPKTEIHKQIQCVAVFVPQKT